MKDILLTYTRYNYWANNRICTVITSLLDELFIKEVRSSFPSVKETLMHMWWAEHIWLRRVSHQDHSGWEGKDYKGTIGDACSGFINTSKKIVEVVSAMDDQKPGQQCNYKNMEGKEFTHTYFEMLFHCMNHSTFHRGQIITMLREIGSVNLPSTDFIIYLRENK